MKNGMPRSTVISTDIRDDLLIFVFTEHFDFLALQSSKFGYAYFVKYSNPKLG